MRSPTYQKIKREGTAFSLVEVVLSLGIASVVLLSLLALLPVGIQSTRESVAESRAINLLSEIIADRLATTNTQPSAIYQIPALTVTLANPTTNSFGVGEDGRRMATLQSAHYRVDYRLQPPATSRKDPYLGHFRVSWPATSSASNVSSVESVAAFPQ